MGESCADEIAMIVVEEGGRRKFQKIMSFKALGQFSVPEQTFFCASLNRLVQKSSANHVPSTSSRLHVQVPLHETDNSLELIYTLVVRKFCAVYSNHYQRS